MVIGRLLLLSEYLNDFKSLQGTVEISTGTGSEFGQKMDPKPWFQSRIFMAGQLYSNKLDL